MLSVPAYLAQIGYYGSRRLDSESVRALDPKTRGRGRPRVSRQGSGATPPNSRFAPQIRHGIHCLSVVSEDRYDSFICRS